MNETPPLNICQICDKEVKGWVDNPEEPYTCDECLSKDQED